MDIQKENVVVTVEKLKERLINISSKNNTLLFKGVTNKKTSFDLYSVESKKEEVMQWLLTRNPSSFLITKDDILKKKETFLISLNIQRLQKLLSKQALPLEIGHSPITEQRFEQNTLETVFHLHEQEEANLDNFEALKTQFSGLKKNALDIFKESGKEVLYVGFPFLEGAFPDGSHFRAPIFLFPIQVDVKNNAVSITHQLDNPVLFNQTLYLSFSKHFPIANPLSTFELENFSDLHLSDMDDVVTYLKTHHIPVQFCQEPPRMVDRYVKKDFLARNGLYIVKNHAAIHFFDVANALFEDYNRLSLADLNDPIQRILGFSSLEDKEDVESEELEETSPFLPVAELGLISNLDTSQEYAVFRSQKSKNMVIYGPPGTGKSEVIVNIIANSLHRNETVLVVSQKKAALDVIYKRLGALNQHAFLITDSSKYKRAFYKKLQHLFSQTLEGKTTGERLHSLTKEMSEKSQQISIIIEQLETIHTCLTTIQQNSLSLSDMYKKSLPMDMERSHYFLTHSLSLVLQSDYNELLRSVQLCKEDYILQAFSTLSFYKQSFPLLDMLLQLNKMDTYQVLHTMGQMGQLITSIEKEVNSLSLSTVFESENVYSNLHNCLPDEWQKKWMTSFVEKETEEIRNLKELMISQQFAINHSLIVPIAEELTRLHRLTYDPTLKEKTLYSLFANYTNDSFQVQLSNEMLQQEFDTTHAVLQKEIEQLSKWSFKKLLFPQQTKKTLLNKTLEWEERKKEFDDECKLLFEKVPANIQFETLLIQAVQTKIAFLEETVQRKEKEFCTKSVALLTAVSDYLNSIQLLKRILTDEQTNQLIDFLLLKREQKKMDDLLILKEISSRYTEVLADLRHINSLNGVEVEILTHLTDIRLTTKEEITMYLDELIQFYLNYHIQRLENEEQYALLFRTKHFDTLYKQFFELMNGKNQHTAQLIRSILIQNTCSFATSQEPSYKAFLKESNKQKRNLSIREFCEKYWSFLSQIVPVWVLTPEAAAQILPSKKELFDVVIFDEASQMFVEKALPFIQRGKRIIIAGDEKQLSPTATFLNRYEGFEDDEDEDEVNDALTEQSLLHLAKLHYDAVHLNYHYRSKYAELINFSNHGFYQGRLKLAPNVVKDYSLHRPIERIMVEGIWDKGKNHEEAHQIVELIAYLLKHRKQNESIGVITFNSAQQDLIEKYLQQKTSKDEAFHFLYMQEINRIENEEDISLFVKNIENVQGDERDIIIFCVGYAPDKKGKVSNHFGSLNQSGGENRLNVAISRAKSKIYLVTSIEPEMLSVESSKHEGPKLFKSYLMYARAVAESQQEVTESILRSLHTETYHEPEETTFDSPFEEDVYAALKEHGYEVETQVGVLGYRIDLGVYDRALGCYLAGIECDGARYHSSKSARERDIYRQKFLENKGWNILRIWSKDWWENSHRETKRIIHELEQIRQKMKESLF